MPEFNPLQRLFAGKQRVRDDQLADVNMERAGQARILEGQKQELSSQNKRISGLNKFGRAFQKLPDVASRMELASKNASFAQSLGIDPGIFVEKRLTDEAVNELVSTTSELMRDPSKLQQLTTEQRNRADQVQRLKSEDPTIRGLAERSSGAAAKAGTITAPERIAEDPELASNIADTQATIAGRKKFAELSGVSRAKSIDKGFEVIAGIDKNVRNIDRAIEALNEGAGTGAIESRFFPSIKAASVKLDQIQSELALDVVGATTFGALSEGELNLAREVALPTKLNKDELLEFLSNKKAAQTKLRAYFGEQIQFLDQGGTVAGFLRSKESSTQQGGQQEQAADIQALTQEAEAAIAAGADRDAVMARLQQMTGGQ